MSSVQKSHNHPVLLTGTTGNKMTRGTQAKICGSGVPVYVSDAFWVRLALKRQGHLGNLLHFSPLKYDF